MDGSEGPTSEELHRRVDEASRAAHESSEAMRRLAAVLRIRCGECERVWTDPGERWRARRYDGFPDDVVLLCPGCAELELG